MGFPNIDLWLVDRFAQKFQDAQGDLGILIDDTFSDFTADKRDEICQWLIGREVVTDLREPVIGPSLTILPGFPLVDVPMPQISVVVASETGNDIPLGFGQGEAQAVYDPDNPGTVTGWDVPMGYWATCSYQVQVLCGHWPEVVFLTRLCQRFILGMERTLSQKNVHLEALTVADLQLNPQQFPTLAFARGLTLTCKAWMGAIERLPVSFYQTGTNKAIGGT